MHYSLIGSLLMSSPLAVLAVQPGEVDAVLGLVDILRMDNDWDKALAILNRSLEGIM